MMKCKRWLRSRQVAFGRAAPAAVIAVSITLALAFGSSTWAANIDWTNANPNDNEWGTPGNWAGNNVPDNMPTADEDAVINLAGANAAGISTGSFTFRFLRVGQGAGQTGELNVTSGSLNADGTQQDRIGVGGGTGTVNQSGGSVRLAGNQFQLGLDLNSTGTYNLTGGTLIGARESGGSTLFVADNGGHATFYITEGNSLVPTVFRTRAGVALGDVGHANDAITMGLFHVKGSGIDEIGIGSEGTLDGRWIQQANGTLRTGIDAGGITPIFIDDVGDDGGGAQGNVTFAMGAVLDPYDAGGAVPGIWHTVMRWEGTLANDGLTLSTAAAAAGWEFRFVNTNSGELQVRLVPEPSSLAMLIIGGVAVERRRRRQS